MNAKIVNKGRYPIVLAHGIARFDELARRLVPGWGNAGDEYHYFKRIRTALENAGYTVFHSNVPFARSVDARASKLREQVLVIARDYGRVHIIAHSMGGLDARHMLFNDGRGDADRVTDKVASLSTISAPHHGTSLADVGVERFGRLIERLPNVKESLAGFFDLTRARCEAFNARAEAFERNNDVLYQTFAGVQTDAARVFFVLRRFHSVITEEEGPNDGVVSLKSAKWREALFVGPPLEADHLNQLGWWDPSELGRESPRRLERRIQDFYIQIANGLCDEKPKRW